MSDPIVRRTLDISTFSVADANYYRGLKVFTDQEISAGVYAEQVSEGEDGPDILRI